MMQRLGGQQPGGPRSWTISTWYKNYVLTKAWHQLPNEITQVITKSIKIIKMQGQDPNTNYFMNQKQKHTERRYINQITKRYS